MLALRKLRSEPGVELSVAPEPLVDAGDALIEVAAAGVCGSDLHIASWDASYAFMIRALPVTLGHEFAGVVAALCPGASGAPSGRTGGVAIGDRVVAMPSVTCGACPGCLSIGADACTRRRGLGMTRDGGFASRVVVPAVNCVAIPDDLPLDLAALTEPLTVSAEAVARGEARPGARVLIMGPGTIGQGAAILARLAGAELVVMTGRDDGPRFDTLRALGFDKLIDVADPDATERLRAHAVDGYDTVIEATGVGATIDQGLALLRPGGILVTAGIHARPASIDVTKLVRRNLQIRGSFRSPRAVWPVILATIARDRAAFAPMITHRLPLSDAPAAFALARNKEASKVMLFPRHEDRAA